MVTISSSDKIKFLLTVLICGTGMYTISHHIAYVGKEFAIANRILLGGLIVCGYAYVKNRPFPALTPKACLSFLISGTCLYSLNYLLIYEAVLGIPSGICSLIVAAIIVPNSLFGILILRTKVKPKVLIGASVSLIGLAILYPGNIFDFDISKVKTISFLCMLASLFVSAFGTVMTSKFMKNDGMDFYWMTGMAMVVGGTISMANGFWVHGAFPWSWDPMHFVYWLYMAIPCTAIVFVLYLQIVNKFGAGNASYIWILSPTIAMTISYFFEDMELTSERMVGAAVILLGSLIAVTKSKFTKSATASVKDTLSAATTASTKSATTPSPN